MSVSVNTLALHYITKLGLRMILGEHARTLYATNEFPHTQVSTMKPVCVCVCVNHKTT